MILKLGQSSGSGLFETGKSFDSVDSHLNQNKRHSSWILWELDCEEQRGLELL